MKTKIDFIDENIGEDLTNKTTTYICSKFGVGKTSLLVKIAANYSLQDNKKILFIVSMDDNLNLIQRKFLSVYTSKSMNQLDKNETLDNKFLGENTTLKITKSFNPDDLDYDLIVIDDFDGDDIFRLNNYYGHLFVSKTNKNKMFIDKNCNYIFLNRTSIDKENDTAKVNIITKDFVVNDLKINFNSSNLNISKMN